MNKRPPAFTLQVPPLPDISAGFRAAMEQMSAQMRQMAEQVAVTVERMQVDVPRLAEYGWTLPMTMSPRGMFVILEEGSQDLVDHRLDNFYVDGELERLRMGVARSPLIERHALLLQQCGSAFDRGEFALCVPALLTVLEGALAELDPNVWSTKGRIKFFEEKSASPSLSIKGIAWKSLSIFCGSMYENVPFHSKQPATLNRNWILHGRSSPKDWRRVEVIRLYNALNTLASIARPTKYPAM
jgi:hypothetical protein